jgi:hypothetical protein
MTNSRSPIAEMLGPGGENTPLRNVQAEIQYLLFAISFEA